MNVINVRNKEQVGAVGRWGSCARELKLDRSIRLSAEVFILLAAFDHAH